MFINLINYLIVNTIIFLIGVSGLVLNRKNILIILMSIELTVAAAESAIGLAILVVYYRVRGTIAVERVQTMRG